jgi:asparagine synthase (glutamine-hydrolysing)
VCGILGVATRASVDGLEERVKTGLDAIDHRGPDARAVTTLAGGDTMCVLGHTRLRIIDLSPDADQPMSNEDQTVWVSYNGELYNLPELRPQLDAAGHRFRSRSDTELLVHLYEDVAGDVSAMLGRLRGMFAFALFDTPRGRLVLARDRLGIKPMYYADLPGGLAFGSETRALARAGFNGGGPDLRGVGDYLIWGRQRAETTLFEGVRALRPGTYLDWKDGITRTKRWYQIGVALDPEIAADPPGALRAVLEDSVSRHLIADRPVGVFLSGGLDSGVVLRTAARSGSVRALTVTFPEVSIDEGRAAAQIATEVGAQHDRVDVTGAEIRDSLPRIIASMDQPTADGVNTWIVSRAAHQAGLVVALSGLGGDELFGGYPSFTLVPRVAWATAVAGLLPAKVRRQAVRVASRRDPGGRVVRVLASERGFVGAYGAVRQLFAPAELYVSGVALPLTGGVAQVTARDPADRVMLLEAENYLADQLLRDADQMSMAHSLEVRVPLLDDRLVHVALALPASTRAKGDKGILAKAAGVPQPRKQPFSLPFDMWMRGPLREVVRDALMSQELPFAIELPLSLRRHLWASFEERRIHWSRVWSICVLRLWPEANGLRW